MTHMTQPSLFDCRDCDGSGWLFEDDQAYCTCEAGVQMRVLAHLAGHSEPRATAWIAEDLSLSEAAALRALSALRARGGVQGRLMSRAGHGDMFWEVARP